MVFFTGLAAVTVILAVLTHVDKDDSVGFDAVGKTMIFMVIALFIRDLLF